MKCPDHFFDVSTFIKTLDVMGVRYNSEEIFSAADFLHKFSFPRRAFATFSPNRFVQAKL